MPERPRNTETASFSSNGSNPLRNVSVIPLTSQEPRHAVRLQGKVALIVGGAGDQGRALAVSFAERGISSVIVYFEGGHETAEAAKREVEAKGQRCLLINGGTEEARDKRFSRRVMAQLMESFGRLDIYVNLSSHDFLAPLTSIRDPEKESLRSRLFPNIDLMTAAFRELSDQKRGNQ